jgi:hypothetical protein
MLIKQVGKNTVELKFKEEKEVEFKMMGCEEIRVAFSRREVV